VLVSMESIGMWQQVGFLADMFERFKRHGLSVDLIGSAETNVTVSLDPSDNLVSTNVLDALCATWPQVCRVKVIAPCAAITLVGRGMRSLLHKLSDVLADLRPRARAPDLAVLERPQPHLRHRRGRCRRHAAAAARRC
jgi:bifunctional diaminopimelate decarboxylase / aspartate kinase